MLVGKGSRKSAKWRRSREHSPPPAPATPSLGDAYLLDSENVACVRLVETLGDSVSETRSVPATCSSISTISGAVLPLRILLNCGWNSNPLQVAPGCRRFRLEERRDQSLEFAKDEDQPSSEPRN
jgi:hypothetical protein